jgi:hypothetical protein
MESTTEQTEITMAKPTTNKMAARKMRSYSTDRDRISPRNQILKRVSYQQFLASPIGNPLKMNWTSVSEFTYSKRLRETQPISLKPNCHSMNRFPAKAMVVLILDWTSDPRVLPVRNL